ncbi:protein kinase domain-containing protein [Rosistilla oblonga]|uniref:protein kinase domain-containing protein n=1 Tax=Rosistilla oblonga TaxID=2527990 RepID=UPI003A976042
MGFDTTQAAYQDLRAIIKENSDSVVAWTGAGLSMPAKLPSWDTLKNTLIDELQDLSHRETGPKKLELEKISLLANSESNYWNCFALLKRHLGIETYRAAIKRAFRHAETTDVPEVYRQLWQLKISGMITLNIDQFATRAYGEVNGSSLLNNFTGKNIGSYVHILRSNSPWLANFHGILPEVSSWVFTKPELGALFEDPGYDQFIKACFASRTVVFIGMSADDVAAGEHLYKLTEKGVDCGGHFWITNDTKKRDWAESAGIRLITYRSNGSDHSELLQIFGDLMKFIPVEEDPAPIVAEHGSVVSADSLPSPEKLEVLPAHKIRDILNGYASCLLAETNLVTVTEYEEFAKKYAEAIYRSWFVDTNPPKNRILGYDILDDGKDGAFGTVYRASDSSGKQFAVKVLHEKVRKNREMLQSFRRGVASMRILTASTVPGVVRYYDASEIPAVVVMDFVEGINLTEATKKSVLSDWVDLIRVCLELTQVIRRSHRLPQRVLHRDIRPSNVMLENCWGPNPNWEEVKLWVLDFDLSHHKDAFDVSISQPGQANGFLAPEQVERSKGVSTRNATVDSYGLGMTFYYLRSSVEPRFAQHRYQDWSATLDGCAHNNPCKGWKSLPMRFSRLIESSVSESQSDRLDVSGIENELIRLQQAILSPGSVASAELITEELAAKVFGHEYSWNKSNFTASHHIGNIEARLIGDESSRIVRFEYKWIVTDLISHQDVKRWLPAAKDEIASALRKAGWEAKTIISTGVLEGRADIDVDIARRNLSQVASSLESAKDALTFN